MSETNQYAPLKKPESADIVANSVARDSAFSKPGSVSKGWKPAKGTRFRPTNEKARGRPRKRRKDPRSIQFY